MRRSKYIQYDDGRVFGGDKKIAIICTQSERNLGGGCSCIAAIALATVKSQQNTRINISDFDSSFRVPKRTSIYAILKSYKTLTLIRSLCVFIFHSYIWRWFDKCQSNHSVENYGKIIVAKWTIERKMDATNMADGWRTSKEFSIDDYDVLECVDFQQFCYLIDSIRTWLLLTTDL